MFGLESFPSTYIELSSSFDYSVDATNDNNRCGRLINHSRTAANAVTKVLSVDGQPYLYLVAATDVSPGDELQYDYGDHTRASVEAHPWLKL